MVYPPKLLPLQPRVRLGCIPVKHLTHGEDRSFFTGNSTARRLPNRYVHPRAHF